MSKPTSWPYRLWPISRLWDRRPSPGLYRELKNYQLEVVGELAPSSVAEGSLLGRSRFGFAIMNWLRSGLQFASRVRRVRLKTSPTMLSTATIAEKRWSFLRRLMWMFLLMILMTRIIGMSAVMFQLTWAIWTGALTIPRTKPHAAHLG